MWLHEDFLVRTSRDLLHWSDPTTIFSLAPGETGGPESPTLLALHGGFYLIWCRWDAKLSAAGEMNQNRSFVYYSYTPLNLARTATIPRARAAETERKAISSGPAAELRRRPDGLPSSI
jgi:hypothetical protein